jgi:dihydroorotase-like cyclic amidohydrolase
VLDLDRPFVVKPEAFESKSVNTPFTGWTLRELP